ISEEVFNKISNYTINKGNIFLSIVGTIGLVDVIEEELDKSSLTENAVKIYSNDEKQLSTEFLSYFLKSTMGQHEISIRTVGSTQPKLAITRIKDINVPMVDIEKQYKIIWVLSNIDKKIKLNRTIIANLEELSQTLFKRWFVDFEFPDKDGNPYKSSGGEISDTNNLPANWKYQSAKDIYTINIGKTPPRKLTELFNTKNGIDWVSISDMKADGPFINITKENLSESAVKEYRVKLVPKNSVLLSFKLTIGRVKITNKELATNEAIAHFVTNTINSIYTYLYLKKFNFESLGNTSSIANAINSKIVKEMPILVPTSEILEKFKEIITPIFEKIELQQKENILLTQLRDTLLPKLMSGEIELPDDIEVNTDELSI
ncbi:TPA: restriction endonuclease subunit S, partial [Staphylococcus pseudintermedius]|nr:restriction endonuclease subunit S [Staphylococcus pseudintermedius]